MIIFDYLKTVVTKLFDDQPLVIGRNICPNSSKAHAWFNCNSNYWPTISWAEKSIRITMSQLLLMITCQMKNYKKLSAHIHNCVGVETVTAVLWRHKLLLFHTRGFLETSTAVPWHHQSVPHCGSYASHTLVSNFLHASLLTQISHWYDSKRDFLYLWCKKLCPSDKHYRKVPLFAWLITK